MRASARRKKALQDFEWVGETRQRFSLCMHDCATMKHARPVKPNVPDVPASGVQQPLPLRRMRSRSIRRWPALICSVTRADRIAAIRTRWIRYARAEQIGARLDELLVLPKTHRMPNLLIVGETNNGKAALVKHFVHRHPRQLTAPRTILRIPVIAVQAPPVPDERRFYRAILAQAAHRFDRHTLLPSSRIRRFAPRNRQRQDAHH